MNCLSCNSRRILSITAKCSDCFSASIGDIEIEGYVPCDLGIGGGDYIMLDLCLDCGKMQDKFPIPLSENEIDCTDEELLIFFREHFVQGEMFSRLREIDRKSIINNSGELSRRFQKFITKMMNFYADSNVRIPEFHKFISMYKNSQYELDE
jgi:hypothetical protein